jgi:NADPH-dependent 2,4-dienoyl-CoA reductase/sulfur reductase-like enzyme
MTATDSAERLVVVGAGLAGLRTVVSLRDRGFDGQIVLIGTEKRAPYDRPPLSKKVLTEGIDPSLDADFSALGVDFHPGETVTGLGNGTVTSNHGQYSFDYLVIATGSEPVALPGTGPQRFLRTYDDALALRGLLRPGLRLAIVGAGWIGGELATAAAALGAEVTVIEAGPAPLAGVLGQEVGAATEPWYAAAGVRLRTGTSVESVEPGGLALAGGEWLPADEIVTAVGARPVTGWLAGSGVDLVPGKPGGVAVDAGLRTNVPGVYAAGDCAAFESGLFGVRMRVEHWDAALHAPEVVAANIVAASAGSSTGGGDAEPEVYDPVPYFWSDQFGRMVQYVGHHGQRDRLVWRGDPAEPKWSACWVADAPADGTGNGGGTGDDDGAGDGDGAGADGAAPRLTALLTVGRPKDMIQARRLISARGTVDVARLADPAVAVKDARLSSSPPAARTRSALPLASGRSDPPHSLVIRGLVPRPLIPQSIAAARPLARRCALVPRASLLGFRDGAAFGPRGNGAGG